MFVGVNDILDNPVPDDIFTVEMHKFDVFDVAENFFEFAETSPAVGHINLGKVSGDYNA